MNTSMRTLTALSILFCGASLTHAATYITANGTSGTTVWDAGNAWADASGNILPSTFPNAPGDVAIFGSAAVGSVPAQTGNRVYNYNTSSNGSPNSFTVGELDFNLLLNTAAASQRDTIGNGSGGTLTMSTGGNGPAVINVNADPTTLNIAQMVNSLTLTSDNLVLNIAKTNRTDNIGGLRFMTTASITGPGGITRNGPTGSLWNLETNVFAPDGITPIKFDYTGPTVLAGGRTRIAPASQPFQSSSFTVQGGAQLEATADGKYAFGNGTLHLNGDLTGDGASGVFRPARTTLAPTKIEVTNPTVSLESPLTLVHSEGQAVNGADPSQGFIQFDGVITGGPTNKLQLTTTSHSANHGTYALTAANTFSGGIDLYGGRLSTDFLTDGGVFNSSTVTTHPNATFGTGDVHAIATPSTIALSESRVTIPSGVVNAIGNHATLSIDGLNPQGYRSAYAELGDGVDEVVGNLVLGGVTQLSGVTYGSTANTGGAIFTNDTYFTGTGMVQVGTPGDFNGNGTVDAADYVLWRKSYSANTSLYDLWRANFGNVAPGSGSSVGGSGLGLGSSAVPEPSTFVLLAMTIAPLLTNRRRRFA